jgi:hypothetical protein
MLCGMVFSKPRASWHQLLIPDSQSKRARKCMHALHVTLLQLFGLEIAQDYHLI